MKTTYVVVGVVAIIGAGALIGMTMYKDHSLQHKISAVYSKRVKGLLERAVADRKENSEKSAYECGNFKEQCTSGDVGGCRQYEDTCRSAQSVKSSRYDPSECGAFSSNCIDGDYTSCNLYTRSCQ
jgi:hypothetical protein